jgi:hypothetical protein
MIGYVTLYLCAVVVSLEIGIYDANGEGKCTEYLVYDKMLKHFG